LSLTASLSLAIDLLGQDSDLVHCFFGMFHQGMEDITGLLERCDLGLEDLVFLVWVR